MTTTMNTHLEKYTLETELSQNEWVTVYRAVRNEDQAVVVVKIPAPILAADEFFRRRFGHITQQTAQLEHPNIIQTYEAEKEDDFIFMAQDFVEARSLAEALETEGPFSIKRTLKITRQIASALDYAHHHAVLHGELAVHQIYLAENDHVLISNFGQSQAIFGNNLTRQSYALTAPEIIAPERVWGEGPSRPADLYSLGIICYQMLANESPFTGPASTVFHAHAHKQPRPLHLVNSSVPLSISEVIGRMLAKSVDVRYNTGAEFARALLAADENRGSTRQYEALIPIEERERSKGLSFKAIFYLCSAAIVTLLVAALSAWTGYELGLKQSAPVIQSPPVIVDATLPTPTPTEDFLRELVKPTNSASDVILITPTEEVSTISLNDILLPTRTPFVERLLPTRTATPTLTPTPLRPVATATPTVSPTPAVVIPAGQGQLIFYNPTGHDLIVDLVGPTPDSTVISAYSEQEFFLRPGSYVYMAHTPGGHGLEATKGDFELAAGQVIEKDYYSDYNWQQ